MMFTRSILDLYHGDKVDIPLLANNGAAACLLKATQGTSYVDPEFKNRLPLVKFNDLLFGSYHFGDGSDPIKQVGHWLDTALPNDKDALEFDWEDNGQNSMSYEQACEFVAEVFRRTGRYPLLYGSNFLREKIPAGVDSILFKCPLSLASYNSAPKIPRGWEKYTLWQYTGDGVGAAGPMIFPGASNFLDVSQFDGTLAELRRQWPFGSPA